MHSAWLWTAMLVTFAAGLWHAPHAAAQTRKTTKSPAAPAAAPPAADPAKALTFSSRAYRITTDLEKPLAQEIGKHMDAVYAEYSRAFDRAKLRGAVGINQPLFVWSTQEAYMRMLADRGIDATGTGGMFFDGSSLATFLGDQGSERMYHTLQHEGFHQFAHFRLGRELPTWANEGLAEYFGEGIMVGGKLRLGQVPVEKLAVLKQAIEKNLHIPFEELLNMSHAEWNSRVADGDEAAMQYDQAWSICHFLVHADPRYEAAFNAYLRLVAGGGDSPTAFAKAFGSTNYKQFEDAWKKFILKLEPNPEKTAAKRLEFMARGMRWLAQNDQPFASLDELKLKLQQRQFRMRYTTGHGGVLEISSMNDENFQPPDSGNPKSPATLEWIAPKAPGTLPELAVRGLKLTVRLKWNKDPSTGKDVAKIVYE